MQTSDETSDDTSLAAVYAREFPALVRLAAMLLDDVAEAEDVVQETYLRVARSGARLRESGNALAYLRQSVVNLARSKLRRRVVARRYAPVLTAHEAADRSAVRGVRATRDDRRVASTSAA